jgi:alpha-glucosidase
VDYSVEAQDGAAASTLEFYRKALGIRAELVCVETWSEVKHLFNRQVFHFKRPNGWQSITNFGSKPVKLPEGELLITSQPLVDGKLGPNTTAWIK